MTNHLESLKNRFHPRRHYEFDNMCLDVDGVFVRVDEGGFVLSDEDKNAYLIPVEDVLQDPAIIRSARTSTGRDSAEVNEKAAGLIGSLYRDEHQTPFEGGVVFRLRLRVPIYAAQPFFQLMYSHNEFSGRYSIIDGAYSVPHYAKQDINADIFQIFEEAERDSQAVYRLFLSRGVAKEQARFALLYRFFTQFYWTVSLRHVLELLSLEENSLSPKEFWNVRDHMLRAMVQDWTPWSYDKFIEYPKKYKTLWHKNIMTPSAMKCSGKSIEVANIGHVRLVSACVDEDLIKIGVQTGPNPKRGFGHGVLTFALRVPIFVHRQWVRHRYGVWTELMPDFDIITAQHKFYVPKRFRTQGTKTMAYAYEDMLDDENEEMRTQLRALIERNRVRYTRLRAMGIPPNRAAVLLPYVFMVDRIWTVNMESLMNFFSLRCDAHAQWEIRQFADTIYKWFASKYPWANKIFLEHLNYGSSSLFEEQKKLLGIHLV